MKRKLEVGQVWTVKSRDPMITDREGLFWTFEIVAKIKTPDGIRCIAAKQGTPLETSASLTIFNEDGTRPDSPYEIHFWYLTKKSKRPAVYTPQKT